MRRFLLPLGLVVVADQVLKMYIERALNFGDSIQLIPGLLEIIRVHNLGAAFGMLPGQWPVFIVCALVVLLLGCYLAMTDRYPGLHLIMGIIAGGAVGNLLDRLRFGYVIDYISVSFFPPVFNMADIAITVGAVLLVLKIWKTEE